MVHAKLVKSYAMDALLQKETNGDKASVDKAKSFIEEAARCEEKKYKSVVTDGITGLKGRAW